MFRRLGGWLLGVLFSLVCRRDVCVLSGASYLCGLGALCTGMLQGRSPFFLHQLFPSSAFPI